PSPRLYTLITPAPPQSRRGHLPSCRRRPRLRHHDLCRFEFKMCLSWADFRAWGRAINSHALGRGRQCSRRTEAEDYESYNGEWDDRNPVLLSDHVGPVDHDVGSSPVARWP